VNQEIILIVEDNPVLREGLQEILSLEGFQIIASADGQEALEEMHKVKPDLILSDIAMPIMDGYEFFKAVRARPDWVAIPFLFLTARGEKEAILTGKDMGAEDYLVKPVSREDLLTAVRARLVRSRQLRVAQLQQAYETGLSVLGNAIELRDHYTRGHVERVMSYAIMIAEQMGWKGKRLDQLRFGAILHDIGKIHIPESILAKIGPLNAEEWEEIRKHPVTGEWMIKDIAYLAMAAPIVRHHHERWDGKGYPDGLAGDLIPLPARIVAVADSFDAMTTRRPYSPTLTLDQAYSEILHNSGTQYDPQVVDAFRRAWEAGLIHSIASQTRFDGKKPLFNAQEA
jgi:putative two-component system response regulator